MHSSRLGPLVDERERTHILERCLRIWTEETMWPNPVEHRKSSSYHGELGVVIYFAIKGDRVNGAKTHLEEELIRVDFIRQVSGNNSTWSFAILDDDPSLLPPCISAITSNSEPRF